MSQPLDNNPEALEDILNELEALGEAPPAHASEALQQATLLGDALDAVRHGADAIEALPAPDDEARTLPMAGLHMLRAANDEGRLETPRAEALWRQIAAQLPDAAPSTTEQAQPTTQAHSPQEASKPSADAKVIAFPFWRAAQATFAAAAALLLLIGAALVIISVQHTSAPPTRTTSASPTQASMVPQIELERAEAKLEALRRSTLKTLMSPEKSTPSPSGDHALRALRDARQEATRARMQARARRL